MELKEQAEQAVLRKEKAREAELLNDKLLLENILKHNEEAKNFEKVAKCVGKFHYCDNYSNTFIFLLFILL